MAQNEDVIYSFSESEIKAINANTLADLVRYMPFISARYEGSSQLGEIGVHPLQVAAIYIDGHPVFMDNNNGINLQLVSLHQINRVELRSPGTNAPTKNQASFNIYLFSNSYDEKPNGLGVELMNTSNNDFLSSVDVAFSNKKHSVAVGLSRYFENGLKLNPADRKFDWASFTNYQGRLRYKYQFFNTASIELDYQTSVFDKVSRTNIYEGTTRAEDHVSFSDYHWLRAKMKAQLSKTHVLQFSGQFNVNSRYNYTKEKDLSTGRTELLPVAYNNDSVSYRYSAISVALFKKDTVVNYGYSVGLEYSSVQDRNYPSINAIKIGYTDYSLFGSAYYKPIEEVDVNIGIRYVTNSLMGSMVLPRAQVKFNINPTFSVRIKHNQSVVYPQLYQQFYDSRFTDESIENNLQLQMGLMRVTNVQLFLDFDELQVRTGMNFSGMNNVTRVIYNQNTWGSSGSRRDMATYFALDYRTKQFSISPILAIHGLNALTDTFDQLYFLPEFCLKTSYYSQKLGLGVNLFAKILGQKSLTSRVDENIRLSTFEPYQLLDLSITKTFIDGKLQIRSGLCNIFNVLQKNKTIYNLLELEQSLLGSEQVFIGRGRTYFIRLTLQI